MSSTRPTDEATTVPAAPNAGARAIWARLTVDPLAVPLSRRIARWPGVTPNRVTGVSAVLALVAAACFATGWLRVGGVAFVARFFVDCMDGQVARFQGTSSKAGAAFDIIVDVVGISACAAALSWYLVEHDLAPTALVLAVLAVLVVYNWSLAYRKGVAAADVEGDGGNGGRLTVHVPGLGAWVRFCQRIGMSPLPWSVEAEIVALGLCPLVLPQRWVFLGLVLALAFYAVATLINLRRIWRLARDLDTQTGGPAARSESRSDPS